MGQRGRVSAPPMRGGRAGRPGLVGKGLEDERVRVGVLLSLFSMTAASLLLARCCLVCDDELLLPVQSGYGESELEIAYESWMADKALKVSPPGGRGVNVLGVARSHGIFFGVTEVNNRVEWAMWLPCLGRAA